ncbi:kinesin [Chloropicon primus]|uniref:Kinesin-like protein n=1 Tax=Chloropicon primus TaxID=1764295 RepID=A0A5B8MRN8_9CHLO|nr:kinesin [Chloropicon primus]UPR01531.1 kinesin [Chloropicon primus]|eukprot:QDZ22315.1 kinesin [Chloropicon primus]
MGSKDMEKLAELVDASLKFTRVLKKKGVSQATLQVAVRCRPLTPTERSLGSRPITRLVDNKIVVVMDPEPNHQNHNMYGKGHSSAAQKREKKYVFDVAFDGSCDNREIYGKTVGNLVPGVLRGLNATVFAYGATGSGKTYTMVGSNMDPGLMVLSLRDIFEHIDRDTEKQIDVTCSYLEVYNEIIYDLLQPTAAQRGLDLREDPENGPQVAGLRRLKVHSAEKIFQLLREGNLRRRTESTDANAESSRSHAVLEIVVRRSDKNHYAKNVYTGKLALVDLAGAERAHETNNQGQQLRDGANINRSLLALANCINALGKRKKKGFVFVPFRNSKLTRLLKDGLCGNSRTIMIATCASADSQYSHTVNTLKYADRAKEIKTHVRIDKKTVDTHIAEYQRMIDALQEENRDLKMAVQAMTGAKWQGIQNIPKFDALSRPALEAAKTPQPKKAAKVEKDTKDEQKAAWMRRTSESMKTLCVNRSKCQQELLEAHQRKVRHQIDAEMIAEQIQIKLKSDETHEIQMLNQRKSDATISLSDSNASVAHLENTMSSYDAQLAILEAEIESSSASVERDALRLQAVAGRRETENIFSKIDAKARSSIIMEQNSVISCLWQILERHGVTQDMATETAWKSKIFPQSSSGKDPTAFFQDYKSVNNSEQKEILKKALTGYKNDLDTKQWSDLSSITASTTEKASKATARMAEAAVLVQATKNDPNPNPASKAARTNTLRSSDAISSNTKFQEKMSNLENSKPVVRQAFGSPSSKENSNPKLKSKSKKSAESKKGKNVQQIGNLKLAMRKRRQSITER